MMSYDNNDNIFHSAYYSQYSSHSKYYSLSQYPSLSISVISQISSTIMEMAIVWCLQQVCPSKGVWRAKTHQFSFLFILFCSISFSFSLVTLRIVSLSCRWHSGVSQHTAVQNTLQRNKTLKTCKMSDLERHLCNFFIKNERVKLCWCE